MAQKSSRDFFYFQHLNQPLTAYCCCCSFQSEMMEQSAEEAALIKSFNGSHCVLQCSAWQKCVPKKCTSRNILCKIFSSFRPLLSRHEHISFLPLCFSNTHWLLWKCQRPHQKPLLLRFVVAWPSKTPHYWLMKLHQLHSIKTQCQPHVDVSPGQSEPRLTATHRGRRLLNKLRLGNWWSSGGWSS